MSALELLPVPVLAVPPAPPPEQPGPAAPWFVTYIRPFHERRVEQALRDQGFDAWCPVETVWRRHARKREAIERPLFVRYLFVAVDHPRQAFRTVALTDGVDRILGAPEPRRVPAAIVAGLKQAAAEGLFDRTRKGAARRFDKGQSVRVTSGPFTGFLAEVLEAAGDGERRIRVLFKALDGGRDTPGLIDPARLG